MPQGQWFSILFFLGVFFAAISSLISIMEVLIEAITDRTNWDRWKSILVVGMASLLAGLPLTVSLSRFTAFVDTITVYLVPMGALLAAFSFFWILTVKRARAEINRGASHPIGEWWEPVAKYLFVTVAFLIVILQMLYHIG